MRPVFYNEFVAALEGGPLPLELNRATGRFLDSRTDAAYVGFCAGYGHAMKEASETFAQTREAVAGG